MYFVYRNDRFIKFDGDLWILMNTSTDQPLPFVVFIVFKDNKTFISREISVKSGLFLTLVDNFTKQRAMADYFWKNMAGVLRLDCSEIWRQN